MSGLLAALAFWAPMLALPVVVVCVVDDWFLRPRRQLAAPAGAAPPDPALLRVLYAALPWLLILSFYRLVTVENADFSLVFVLLSGLSGLVLLIERLVLRRRRESAARASGRDPSQLEMPGTVDYARSFFPVLTVLLVVRSFLYEPYRIPSDSMMPTLLDGDFILVNKHAYGLRWPVINRKFMDVGAPQRGDVVVFRYPPDPKVNYVKRLVGLPGDLVEVRDDQLIVNGGPVPLVPQGRYSDGCYLNMRISEESLDGHRHRVLHCRTPDHLGVLPLSACDREIPYGYLCNEATAGASPDLGDKVMRVPEGKYLMIGDNRDNSTDGRVWGFVDESQLVGRASAIWFNWDLQRSGGPKWSRIGTRIE